jgi:N-acetylneuraminate synthase
MSVQFIAEVSSNHGRDLARCLAFIDAAAASGCDAVKFQLFEIRKLFAPEILEKSEEHRNRGDWELPLEFLEPIMKRCHEKGVLFACTPFDLDAVEQLAPFVDFFKVASYELLWDGLLRAVASTGKPVVLSTGMATLPEIMHAVDVLRFAGCEDLRLLHCVSAYPTPAAEANLAAIETIRKTTGVPVGWSDHTVDPAVMARAIHKWGAQTIEFHLDLDSQGAEFSTGHCWLPDQIETVISQVRRAETADGTGVKKPTPSELADRGWRTDPSDGLRPLKQVRETFDPESATIDTSVKSANGANG